MIPKSLSSTEIRDAVRFSDNIMLQYLRLRAVIAFDNHDIRRRMRQAQLHVLLILRGPVTGERRRIVGKFNNYIARSRRALDAFEFAGADQIAPAEFPEDRLIA